MVVTFINDDLTIIIAKVEKLKVFVAFANFVEYRVDCWHWVWIKIYQNLVESPLDVANCKDSAIFLWTARAVETFGIVTKFDDLFHNHVDNFSIDINLIFYLMSFVIRQRFCCRYGFPTDDGLGSIGSLVENKVQVGYWNKCRYVCHATR